MISLYISGTNHLPDSSVPVACLFIPSSVFGRVEKLGFIPRSCEPWGFSSGFA